MTAEAIGEVASDESIRAGARCGSGFLLVVRVVRVVFFLDLLWASAVLAEVTKPINRRLQARL
jgi:hypothetical protein